MNPIELREGCRSICCADIKIQVTCFAQFKRLTHARYESNGRDTSSCKHFYSSSEEYLLLYKSYRWRNIRLTDALNHTRYECLTFGCVLFRENSGKQWRQSSLLFSMLMNPPIYSRQRQESISNIKLYNFEEKYNSYWEECCFSISGLKSYQLMWHQLLLLRYIN